MIGFLLIVTIIREIFVVLFTIVKRVVTDLAMIMPLANWNLLDFRLA